MDKNGVKALILSAGKGKRLGSEAFGLPKAMREANGRPLLGYVLNALDFIPAEDIIIIVGYMKETITGYFGKTYKYAIQDKLLGTGHAVSCASHLLSGFCGITLVASCDMPLIRKSTYEGLIKRHINEQNACTILSGEASYKLPFGRIVRDELGGFIKIAEDRDCTPKEKEITELNAGVYTFDTEYLLNSINELKPENNQKEYYLTDLPHIIAKKGGKIGVYKSPVIDEVLGVNTEDDLKITEQKLALI